MAEPLSEMQNPLGLRTAEQIQELYKRDRDARRSSGWEQDARDAVDFRFGNQLTPQEHDDMQAVGQPDIVIDRIHAAIDRLKAFLTARNPKFSVLPREDSDQKLASTWRIILEYIWNISDGNVQFKQGVDDYATVGVGNFMGYIDREADAGKGEVKMKYIPWASVYWDSTARERLYGDAQRCTISSFTTRFALVQQYPELLNIDPRLDKAIIDIIATDEDEDYPSSSRYNTTDIQTPDLVKDLDLWNVRYKVLTYYEPTKVPFYWIQERTQGKNVERLINVEQFQQLHQSEEFRMGINLGAIQVKEVLQTRWRETAVIDKYILYSTVLNTNICPIVPMPNIWTGTPYPKSDINKNKDAQRLLNKVISTIVMHLQTSAGSKLLVPEGSVDDLGALERGWTNPLYVGEYNAEFGVPTVIQTTPLAAEAYYLIDRLEHYIDLNFGINELSQGLKSGTTGAVRTDLMLKDEGESRGKSKLQDIEASLSRLGTVCKNLAQGHYKTEKLFQVVQPHGGKPQQAKVNVYTDRTNEVAMIVNDITIGDVDVKVVAGSSLPSNRQTEEQVALQLYEKGIVPKKYVAKKAEIDDYEEWLKEMDEIAQLQSQVQQLTEQAKKTDGQMQTMERELRHKDRLVADQKHKADLDEISSGAKANTKVEQAKLGARAVTIVDRLGFELQEARKLTSSLESKVKTKKTKDDKTKSSS